MKKIGIVGLGVIGQALKSWLETNTKHKIYVSDPYKGFDDDLSVCDIIFISIHIPTERNGSQNLKTLNKIIKKLPDVPIYIRTTILPGTCDKLSKKHNKTVYFMPEFLTERTAQQDFDAQPMVFTGDVKLLKKIFPKKKYVVSTSHEAELAKYVHNVFGALKVTYFNSVYEICQKNNLDYANVLNITLLSGYINADHTKVPGPDGLLGYGGKCFPKDVNAFAKCMKKYHIHRLIGSLSKLNKIYRKS